MERYCKSSIGVTASREKELPIILLTVVYKFVLLLWLYKWLYIDRSKSLYYNKFNKLK